MRCGKCSSQFYMDVSTAMCQPCFVETVNGLLLLLIIILIVVFITYPPSTHVRSNLRWDVRWDVCRCSICRYIFYKSGKWFICGAITALLEFMQTASVMLSMQLGWPPRMRSLFSAMSAVNFNIELFAPKCAFGAWWPDSYYVRWLALNFLWLPVILLLTP